MIKMTKSKKPGKQRKAVYQEDMHKRHKLIASSLDKKLRAKIGVKSLTSRVGDTVKVMRGSHKGRTGKVIRVDYIEGKIYVDNIARKKVSGQDINPPIHPSNLVITETVEDAKRFKRKKGTAKKGEA